MGNVGARHAIGVSAGLLLLVACSKPKGSHEARGGDESRFVRGGTGSARVTYQPNVHVMERAEGLAALTAVSHDGTTLLFASAGPKIQSLKPGDVLLIKGLLARKVLAVDVQGSQVAALTMRATLGEVIRDGHIEFNAPIRFTRRVATASPGGVSWGSPFDKALSLAVPEAHAQVAKSLAKGVAKAVVDGWQTTYSITPGNGRMDVDLQLTRDVGGFKGLITGKGYVEDFDLSSGIDVKGGVVDQFDVAFKKLNGVMNFNWEIGKETPGAFRESDRIKLPGALTVPLYEMLDGFPLFLEVSAAVIVQPFITGGMQYSHGAFRVTYDGSQGFQAKEGTMDADGKVSGDIKFIEDRHVSATAPLGMAVNVAAPRIELTLNPLKELSGLAGVEDGDDDEITEAAKKVDMIADVLIKQTLGEEKAKQIKDLGFSMSKAADAMKSEAAAYVQLVTMSAVSNSGMSALGGPCTNTELAITVSVGARAEAFGQNVGSTDTTVFRKTFKKVDPPNSRVCG